MKAIRYFVGILLFCGLGLGLEAAERPGKAKKEKARAGIPVQAFLRGCLCGLWFPFFGGCTIERVS